MARVRTFLAGKGYDAEPHRTPWRTFHAEPFLHKRGSPYGSGLRMHRWPVERSFSLLLENRRLAVRYDRCGFIFQ